MIAGLWSSEVLHSLRLRPETFRSICPDAADPFSAWWSGSPPHAGSSAIFVILDPLATSRQRAFAEPDEAISRTKPRHRGYADAAAKLRGSG